MSDTVACILDSVYGTKISCLISPLDWRVNCFHSFISKLLKITVTLYQLDLTGFKDKGPSSSQAPPNLQSYNTQ